jgi:hypothetical protein
MNILSIPEPPIAFSASNDYGETISELDAPTAIRTEIERNISQRRHAGVVYNAGLRWQWSLGRPDDILIELTRGGEIEDCIAVPLAGWMAFQLCAVRRGVDAQEWLTTVLSAAMEDGQTVKLSRGFSRGGQNELQLQARLEALGKQMATTVALLAGRRADHRTRRTIENHFPIAWYLGRSVVLIWDFCIRCIRN